MKHLQIFYPDKKLIRQVLDWVLPVKNTTINVYEDDDMSRIDIDTEEKLFINYHKDSITLFIGPAVVLLMYNEFECINIR